MTRTRFMRIDTFDAQYIPCNRAIREFKNSYQFYYDKKFSLIWDLY